MVLWVVGSFPFFFRVEGAVREVGELEGVGVSIAGRGFKGVE